MDAPAAAEREIRTRLRSVEDRLSRVGPENPPLSLIGFGVTVEIARYPTVPGAWYGIQPCAPGGEELEGAVATITAIPGALVFLAWNTGATVPKLGSEVIYFNDSGSWYFA